MAIRLREPARTISTPACERSVFLRSWVPVGNSRTYSPGHQSAEMSQSDPSSARQGRPADLRSDEPHRIYSGGFPVLQRVDTAHVATPTGRWVSHARRRYTWSDCDTAVEAEATVREEYCHHHVCSQHTTSRGGRSNFVPCP